MSNYNRKTDSNSLWCTHHVGKLLLGGSGQLLCHRHSNLVRLLLLLTVVRTSLAHNPGNTQTMEIEQPNISCYWITFTITDAYQNYSMNSPCRVELWLTFWTRRIPCGWVSTEHLLYPHSWLCPRKICLDLSPQWSVRSRPPLVQTRDKSENRWRGCSYLNYTKNVTQSMFTHIIIQIKFTSCYVDFKIIFYNE